ncbi:MAG: hypothetical protein WD069_12775 [Planctomycetales bacterium]
METPNISRAERERQLQGLWQSRRGMQEILLRFHGIYPDGVPLPPDDAIIDIILNHEFGDRTRRSADSSHGRTD